MSWGLPDERGELLLAAVLGEGERARESWSAWRGSVQLEDIDAAAYRLLPLAFRRLERLGIDRDPEFARLKGIYRMSWTQNQLILGEGARMIAALRRAGIESMALKGGALQGTAYSDAGVRPMSDLDLLVRPDDAVAACRALEAEGWMAEVSPAEQVTDSTYHVAFQRNGRNLGVELHWYSMMLVADETPLWAAASATELGGEPVRVPSPTDQLLHTAVHGVRSAESHRLLWIVDATRLLARQGSGLDWERLVAEARRRRLTSYAEPALRYLAGVPEAAPFVPAEALSALANSRPSPIERLGARASTAPVGPLTTLAHSVDRYSRYRRLEGPLPRPGYLRVLRMPWGYRSWPELITAGLRSAARSAARRLGRAPRPG